MNCSPSKIYTTPTDSWRNVLLAEDGEKPISVGHMFRVSVSQLTIYLQKPGRMPLKETLVKQENRNIIIGVENIKM